MNLWNFNFPPTSKDCVENVIHNIDVKKLLGFDNKLPKRIKILADILAEIFSPDRGMVNTSLRY